jgi:hypothetical protein
VHGQLGASPDGIISSNHILEIKCPWGAKNNSLSQLKQANSKNSFFLFQDPVTGVLKLKESHNYWHQIQGSLYATDATLCSLFVWTPNTCKQIILSVLRHPQWISNISHLEEFHRSVFLPRAINL